MSTTALVSIIALLLVIVISIIKEEMHPGMLSIGLAILVGGVWAELSGTQVFGLFPTSLFMTLAGVTFLFSMAQVNGTMPKFTTYAIRLCGGNVIFVPVILFLLITFFTTIGPGNIATVTMIAPIALAIAERIGMRAFLMTLLVVGAANGACYSPFAPSGIVSTNLITEMLPDLPSMAGIDMHALSWKIHWNSELVQGIANIGGFLALGGMAWFVKNRKGNLNIDEVAPKPEPFDKKQIFTLVAIAILIVVSVGGGIPSVKAGLPVWLKNINANVGTLSFVLAMGLLLLQAADIKASVRQVPWSVLMMICGVTVLIGVMDKAGGLQAIVSIIAKVSTPVTANFWMAFSSGLVSAYSSSTGVVMPMFMPMVPGLIKEMGGGDPIALFNSVLIGSHLVDTSPLSTLGAMCIACAAASENKTKLFRDLLIWGLSMCVVAGVLSLVFFGFLGL